MLFFLYLLYIHINIYKVLVHNICVLFKIFIAAISTKYRKIKENISVLALKVNIMTGMLIIQLKESEDPKI